MSCPPCFIIRSLKAWREHRHAPETPKREARQNSPQLVSAERLAEKIAELRRMREDDERESWLGRRRPIKDDGWRRVGTVEDLRSQIPENYRHHRRRWRKENHEKRNRGLDARASQASARK